MEHSLESMNQAVWYNQWILNKIVKYLKNDILEVGCGIGNFTNSLIKYGKIWSIDIDQHPIKKTEKKLNKKVKIGYGDIEKGKYYFKKKYFDTIICFNVLEHIKNDENAVENLNKLLKKRGILLLVLPAHPKIYGSLDKHVGHFRRYEMNKLLSLLKSHNFDIILSKRINIIGALGWWFSGKVLKNTFVDLDKLSFFNKIAPFVLPIEDIIGTPIGISILVVAQKI